MKIFSIIMSSFLLFSVMSISLADTLCNPLGIAVRMTPPNDTTTVLQAVLYVLQPTGYRLAVGFPASRTAADIVLQPLPPDVFAGDTMKVSDALLLLIGTNNRLLVDPVHKLISFEKNNRGSL